MISQSIISELKQEASQTRKLLSRVPFDKPAYKPHDKSMPLAQLAVHVAEIPSWISYTLETEGIDFKEFDYKPYQPKDNEDLLKHLDENVEKAVASLEKASDEDLMKPWTMRNGEQVMFTMPKVAVIRSMAMNHLIHHRAQLGVYLRLNNIPIPGMYGPSADEQAG
jgi:uncharacterized damage-inducible protein DinB